MSNYPAGLSDHTYGAPWNEAQFDIDITMWIQEEAMEQPFVRKVIGELNGFHLVDDDIVSTMMVVDRDKEHGMVKVVCAVEMCVDGPRRLDTAEKFELAKRAILEESRLRRWDPTDIELRTAKACQP